MVIQKHISAACTISNGTVVKNNELIFESDEKNVTAFLQSVYKHFEINYSRFYKMDTLSKLGWLAAEILLQGNPDKDTWQPYQTGMVFTNANASLDSDIKYMASVADIPSPALFVYTLPNILAGEISIRNNFKGETAFFIAEDFDAALVEHNVNNLLVTSDLKRCICGWVDVLGDDYKAILFLVDDSESGAEFSAANMSLVFDKR